MSRTTRAAVVLAAALALLVALAGAAGAHVTVSSQDAAPGGFGKLTFRVPNESDTARTVGLRIQIPEEAAMASLRVRPVPGWAATVTNSELDEPLRAHGQEITTYVSVVEFRAEGDAGIAPGEFLEFELSGGPFPEVDAVSYPTVQRYSDGTEAAWIEPTVDGQEPEYPAPVLTLSGGDAAGSAEPAAAAGAGTGAGSTAADGSDGTATVALVLGALGLVAGLAGLGVALSARRRTVAG